MTSPLPDLLPIRPFTRPARGSVTLPGSKSITNRALLLAALCDSPVTLTGALFSEDTQLMAAALRKLGFTVIENEAAKTLAVSDQANAFHRNEPVDLFVGLAGTTARFLTALCAAAPRGVYRLDGVPQMRKRPMRGLIDALRMLGADIRCPGGEGFLPLEIHAHSLKGGNVPIDASESSQLLSALLMVAPLADTATIVTPTNKVRWPFVMMTMNLMQAFGHPGIPSNSTGKEILVSKTKYQHPGETYAIESDATAASYFITLPLIAGGTLHIDGYRLTMPLQGDVGFAKLLETQRLIASLDCNSAAQFFTEGTSRGGIDADFSSFSDTFLTLAAIAPLLNGPTRITGIAHTRKQETDRVANMAKELEKLGQKVKEHKDGNGLTIHPRPLRAGQTIETYGDHRFAMSFAILGSHNLLGNGEPWLTIHNPGCCAKTFPNFFEVLAGVWQNSHS